MTSTTTLDQLVARADDLQRAVTAGTYGFRREDRRLVGGRVLAANWHPATLGYGANRLVIALDDEHVASCSWPWAARGFAVKNAIERAWAEMGAEALAPALALTPSGAIVRPRCEPVSARAPDVAAQLEERLAALTARGLGVAARRGRWGWLGGQVVLYNYGRPESLPGEVAARARELLATVDGGDTARFDSELEGRRQ